MGEDIVHLFNDTGHRASYRDFFAVRLKLNTATGYIDSVMARRLILADRLLFGTVNGLTSFRALLIAMMRAMLGKRTAAICIERGWYGDKANPIRRTVSLLIYKLLERTGRLKVFAIIPYELMPDLSNSTSDWILDPCLWDLLDQPAIHSLPKTALSNRASASARGRLIVLFIGKATVRKGYQELMSLSRAVGTHAIIVSAGVVSGECRTHADEMRAMGMLVEDRRISEEELLSLYGVADYIWCYYNPSSNSLSSGVFGRAVQIGKTAVVTPGSYLDRLADYLGHSVVYDLEAIILEHSSDSLQACKRADKCSSHDNRSLNSMMRISLAKLERSI